ncbi:hypothetical protein GCM10018793_46810 [Streptomyces sulfonofaciens]|uniref:Uncharacterized protein n=1 Tax=Streptomyces sulfonofaciens TaxID=68272 RepID=A0A919GGD1_9ACTN|nr:hypothetical protein GCM10018793_46810 [Streptomyces sulfonofaciens]
MRVLLGRRARAPGPVRPGGAYGAACRAEPPGQGEGATAWAPAPADPRGAPGTARGRGTERWGGGSVVQRQRGFTRAGGQSYAVRAGHEVVLCQHFDGN